MCGIERASNSAHTNVFPGVRKIRFKISKTRLANFDEILFEISMKNFRGCKGVPLEKKKYQIRREESYSLRCPVSNSFAQICGIKFVRENPNRSDV